MTRIGQARYIVNVFRRAGITLHVENGQILFDPSSEIVPLDWLRDFRIEIMAVLWTEKFTARIQGGGHAQ